MNQNIEKNEITMLQENYIENVFKKFKIKPSQERAIPLPTDCIISKQQCPENNSKEQEEMKDKNYRNIIGSWIYLAVATRPDISFAVSQLAKVIENPSIKHYELLNYLHGYLQSTKSYGIKYHKNENQELTLFMKDYHVDFKRSSDYLY